MFFTLERIAAQLPEIKAAIHAETRDISAFKYHPGDLDGAQVVALDDRAWPDFPVGERWGGYDQVAWFRARVAIPQGWEREHLRLRFRLGPRDGYGSTAETQLYVNGFPLQAIDVWHEEAWLPPEYSDLNEISIALRAWSGMFRTPPQRRFAEAKLVRIEPAAERFYYLAETLWKAATQLDQHDYRRIQLQELLRNAFHCIDFAQFRSPAFYISLAGAEAGLRAGLAALQSGERRPAVNAIGHSHIDMAWMWRSKHTREKARRTFSTILHMMREHPDFRYLHSTPQLYKFIQEDDPHLFSRIKERIAAGQWEATGAMWVESDTLIPSGEALVRQILFGKRFYQREFGIDSQVLWLPDSFGFSWALPQLLRKSGIKFFASSIIHWSRFSRFPHDTFRWRGMDGSQVLVTFFTAPGETKRNTYNYNGLIAPYDVKVAWEHYRQKAANQELLMPFGWGDGGGGPTREMVEAIRVQADVPGFARVQMGKVEPYFERLEARVNETEIPVWDGELYLEALRGGYTSQARNKQANRQAEVLYHNAEWMGALADSLCKTQTYPQQALNQGWEMLLHNQFHDILPGTSIHPVVEDSLADYDRIQAIGRAALQSGQQQLLGQIHAHSDSLVVFNPTPWERSELLDCDWAETLENKALLSADGQPLPVQATGSKDERRLLFQANHVPAWGYRVFPLVEAAPAAVQTGLTADTHRLENAFLRITFDAVGQIDSLYDKQTGREVLPDGATGNVLQYFEDRSIDGEAWEIDLYYQEKMQVIDMLVERVVEEAGPLRARLRFTWKFLNSSLTQHIILVHDSPRIDFYSELDWHDHQVMLKTAFPVDIRATTAHYEIQFGNIERTTHWNTPHDQAHFENPAHRWVDLSEADYGVALLNDAKYGYDVKDNVLRLTLHRSPTEPDEQADQGQHTFTYSLLPHQGTWRANLVARQAYALNIKLLKAAVTANPTGILPEALSWAAVDRDHIVLETLKKAEDDDAWIVRLYEYKQMRCENATITFFLPVRRAVEVDLLERSESPLDFSEHKIHFKIQPYEIKTFKVWF